MTDAASLLSAFAGAEPSIELAALLIAREVRPGLDISANLEELDALAAPLVGPIAHATSIGERARLLADHLYGTVGFRGNADDYYDPRNSYLDEVLTRRIGIPLTLSVVLIAVGRRVGLRIDGIGFPGHFLVRLGGRNGPFMDPFDHGRILTTTGLEELASRSTGDNSRLHPSWLEPVGTRTMVIRMLANLKHTHSRRGEHALAMVACDRLVDLTQAPEHRRDRGLLASSLGSFATAVADLEAYLEARPGARDLATVKATLRRAQRRSGENLH